MDKINKYITGETKNKLKCRRNIYRQAHKPIQTKSETILCKKEICEEGKNRTNFIYLFRTNFKTSKNITEFLLY